MRETLRRLSKMIVGYGAIQWAGPFLSFVFTPIITRILAPSDYGIADYAVSFASMFGTVALLAAPQALMAHFNDRADEAWQKRLTGSALALVLSFGIPLGVALFLFAPQIGEVTFHSQTYTHLFRLVGGTLAFGVCGSVLTTAGQAMLRVRWGMLFSATTIAATVVGNVLFIIVLRLGATGMVLTPVVAGVAVCLVSLWRMRQAIGRPSRALMSTLLRSGVTLFPTTISAWALQVIDRFFLILYVPTEALGYYAIANKVAALLYVAMVPFLNAWTPLALAMQREPNAEHRYASMSRYLAGIALAAALALGLFAPEILLVVARPAYLPATPYVGFLAYVHVFSVFTTMLDISAMADKQFRAISVTMVAGAVTNIILNFIFIPRYGVWGATVATVIGYAVPAIWLYVVLRHRAPLPYPVGKLIAAWFVQFGLLMLNLFLPPLHWTFAIAIKLLLMLLLMLSFVAIGIVTPFEVRHGWLALRRLASARLRPSHS
ncbi:MAG: oligosaccharide flippase family protein [Chloroflexi bacterium]|nr:oligosaccharide flippase family protein [Chloroflexota bacterium]